MATQPSNDYRDRPIGEIARELASDVSLLVRQELKLARAEMQEKGRIALPGLGMIGGAGLAALCAAGALTAFLVLVLDLAMPAWLAALITGTALAGVAVVLALTGKERVEEAGSPYPEETIEEVKEDAQWVKERARSGRR